MFFPVLDEKRAEKVNLSKMEPVSSRRYLNYADRRSEDPTLEK